MVGQEEAPTCVAKPGTTIDRRRGGLGHTAGWRPHLSGWDKARTTNEPTAPLGRAATWCRPIPGSRSSRSTAHSAGRRTAGGSPRSTALAWSATAWTMTGQRRQPPEWLPIVPEGRHVRSSSSLTSSPGRPSSGPGPSARSLRMGPATCVAVESGRTDVPGHRRPRGPPRGLASRSRRRRGTGAGTTDRRPPTAVPL